MTEKNKDSTHGNRTGQPEKKARIEKDHRINDKLVEKERQEREKK